jgi:hypothetical protein
MPVLCPFSTISASTRISDEAIPTAVSRMALTMTSGLVNTVSHRNPPIASPFMRIR